MREVPNNIKYEKVRKGPLVPLLDGAIKAPRWLEFTVVGLAYDVEFRTELHDDRYRTMRCCFTQPPGMVDETVDASVGIDAGLLRSIPLTTLATYGNLQFGPKLPEDTADSGADLRARGIHDPGTLTVVAMTYQTARVLGQPVAQAVADRLDCSLPTAAKYIAAAKDDGHLSVSPIHKRRA